jgi:hypothetical protein
MTLLNDIQHNGTEHNELNCDTHISVMLNVIFNVILSFIIASVIMPIVIMPSAF